MRETSLLVGQGKIFEVWCPEILEDLTTPSPRRLRVSINVNEVLRQGSVMRVIGVGLGVSSGSAPEIVVMKV